MWSALLAATLIFAVGLTVADSANAGTYRVYQCLRPLHLPDPAWDAYVTKLEQTNVAELPDEWSQHMKPIPAPAVQAIGVQGNGDYGSYGGTTNACGSTISDQGKDIPGSLDLKLGNGPSTKYHAAETGFQIDIPPGVQIADYKVERSLDLQQGAAFVTPFALVYYKTLRQSSAGAVRDELVCSLTCAYDRYQPGVIPSDATESLRAIVGCNWVEQDFNCAKGQTGNVAFASIKAMQIDLSEAIAPSVTGVGGTLIDDIAGGLHGQETLDFHAADNQSGVYRATIELDNEPVVRKTFDETAKRCTDAGVTDADDFEFDALVPCDHQVDAKLALDADQLPGGTHSLRAYLEDAAGNRTTLVSMREVWISKGPEVEVKSCEPCNGSGGEPRSARIVAGDPRGRQVVRNGTRLTLEAKLVDAGGMPIVGAQVDVLQRVHLPRESFTKVTAVTTDAAGLFHFSPVTTSSRTVRFAFSPRRGSDNYIQTSDTDIAVLGTIRLRARRLRLPPRGQLHLRGHIEASPLVAGVPIEVQARDGRRWRTIAVKRTNANGDLVFNYRFRRITRGTFQFRLLGSRSSDLPIEPTASRTVQVTVGSRR